MKKPIEHILDIRDEVRLSLMRRRISKFLIGGVSGREIKSNISQSLHVGLSSLLSEKDIEVIVKICHTMVDDVVSQRKKKENKKFLKELK